MILNDDMTFTKDEEVSEAKGLTDSQLCSLIDRESANAIGADDLTKDNRIEAMQYYNGEAEGNLTPPETYGSKVVSKDLLDTVEWAMPALMDIFASADDIIRFEPDSPEDEQSCADATNYIGYLIHRRNQDGFVTIHDAVKSALMCRMGAGKAYVEERQEVKEERYEGLTRDQVESLKLDLNVEVVSEEETGPLPQAAMVEGMPPDLGVGYNLVLKQKTTIKEFKNEGLPPEELRIAKDTRVLGDCRFIEHRRKVTLSYLRQMGLDEDKLTDLTSGDDWNEEEQERMSADGTNPFDDDEADESQHEAELVEAYIRCDYDGDGIAEYRKVLKVDKVIFENEVTDEHPFWLMSPILMPYKVIGMSMFDLVKDLQEIKTALWRQTLDNLYLANYPRTEVKEGQVNLDDLLNPRLGGLVRVKGDIGTNMREMSTPFVAGQSMGIIDAIDQLRNTRTGVTEQNSMLSAETLSRGSVGSEGVQAMMSAGVQRLRLIARVLAETGFKRMYYLMLKNVSQHQDKAQQVKINGRWLKVDPREWNERYNMAVSVGIGTFGRQQQIANLTLIGQIQEKVMPIGLAGPTQVYQTAIRTAEAMGYRDSDQFFTAPQEGQQPPQDDQQQSPEAMALIQAEQVKAQATIQKATMDNQTRMQIEQAKIESSERVEMFKAQQDIALQREKMQAEEHRAMQHIMQPQQQPFQGQFE